MLLIFFSPIYPFRILLNLIQPPFTADDRKQTMDKIIKAKLILPAYLSTDARELIRNVSIIILAHIKILISKALK